MVIILNDISNRLRNTSDIIGDTRALTFTASTTAIVLLTASLCLTLLTSAQALYLKHWLSSHKGNWVTLHNPEEDARSRELYAQRLKRLAIPSLFELLPLLMQFAVVCFFVGALFSMFLSNNFYASLTIGIAVLFTAYLGVYQVIIRQPYTPFINMGRTLPQRLRNPFHEIAPDSEILHAGILNCLFTHTSMTPNNFSIFIQLFSLPVEYPRLRVNCLAPWRWLSSLLPSMLIEIYSHSIFNLLPALRLCLVVSDQDQPEQLLVNKEARRAYSTIKTSNPLQNMYLHLLLSRLHATIGDTDHWQDACRILKCLHYSKEHTLELVWLVDSIQLHTLWIKDDFTTRIVEFLRGVVVYLTKCPSDQHNTNLLRTATIMAAEWLMTRQSSDNGNLPLRYILSSQDVHSGEASQKVFVLVENQRLSWSESLQLTIRLYQAPQETDSSSGSVIRTLLIPIMAIEAIAAKNNMGSTSDAVPRIQSGDLWCSLEGLWDLWEGGFNQSDLLWFVLTLVVPPSSSVGGTQSSTVIPLLNEYLRQIDESPALIAEKAFRFIGAALEQSLTTGPTRGELELELQNVQSQNRWLSLHIDNILRRRSTPCVADLEAVRTLGSRVEAIVSSVQPEPDILTLLILAGDLAVSLEAFGQGVSLLESPLIGESDGQIPGSPRPFTFAQLEQEKRSHLISCFFDPQQSTSTCQSVWIMLTEDLYPRWKLLPADWRRDIAVAFVTATEWMDKGQKILAEEINMPRRKAKHLIGATALALVNYSDAEHHWKRKMPLDIRDERFQERLDACAQVYLRLFATAIEELGESAKPHTQHIVNFLTGVPDVLYNRDAIKRIQHVLGIPRRM